MSSESAGRRSIDAALDRLYPAEKDYRFGMQPAPGEPQAPLAEVVVYRAAKPSPHWHYVTYGLTELGAKQSADATLSGFGVEYTLRLVDGSDTPPIWPINFLRWVAQQVWATRQPYDHAHSMNFATKGMLDKYSKGVEGLAFFEDEGLRTITTPNGKVTFINVIPLMAGEYELMGSWDAFKVADEIRAQQTDLLWRVDRKSSLDGPRRELIRARVEKEGSSQGVDFYDLPCTEHEIVLDSVGRALFQKFLLHRLVHGREGKVLTGGRSVQILPGKWHFKFDEKACVVQVPPEEARSLADAIAKASSGTLVKRSGGVQLRISE